MFNSYRFIVYGHLVWVYHLLQYLRKGSLFYDNLVGLIICYNVYEKLPLFNYNLV